MAKKKNYMNRWIVRDGNENDMEGILSLRRIVFGEMEADKLDPRFWKWEFLGGPEGKGLIYIVEEGDRIIGHFADLPRRFANDGRVVRGTLSVDLMVDPNYRRQGIFESLGRFAIRRVREEGALFITAYPIRKESIGGFKKLGWREITLLPVLVFPIRFIKIAHRFLHFYPLSLLFGGAARFLYSLYTVFLIKGKRGIKIERIAELDKVFEAFLDRAHSLFPIMGIRDRNYLTWRYLHHPTRDYTIYRAMKKGEMQGYIILRQAVLLGFHSAVIVDLLAVDEETLLALVGTGIAFGQKAGVDLIGVMIPKAHPYHHLLRKMGFLRSPKTFRLMIYDYGEEKELLNPHRWYVTWGDTDVI